MALCKVEKPFQDAKCGNRNRLVGQFIEVSDERAAELAALGLVSHAEERVECAEEDAPKKRRK